mgnify:CR=1 FL=1
MDDEQGDRPNPTNLTAVCSYREHGLLLATECQSEEDVHFVIVQDRSHDMVKEAWKRIWQDRILFV